uniref:Uncharacterized protein n=1 Tax=Lotus japonicus TaxID=34305 RepID=I3SD31_LOTJA|nr:unknown [Lotus japonicus]
MIRTCTKKKKQVWMTNSAQYLQLLLELLTLAVSIRVENFNSNSCMIQSTLIHHSICSHSNFQIFRKR